jgi:hypothetical protein
MALSYDQSSDLMTDMKFRGRVKVACLEYATYIADEDPKVPAHNSRFRWAQQCFQQPEIVAQQIQNPVVMDPAVQAAGASITDDALQKAVEGVINRGI